MDYIDIKDTNHDKYIKQIIDIINTNPENKTINKFIEKIIKSNKTEYILLCNALFKFINQGELNMSGGQEQSAPEQPATESNLNNYLQNNNIEVNPEEVLKRVIEQSSEVPQNEVSKPEVPQNEVPQEEQSSEVPQNEVSKTEVSQTEVSKTEVSQTEVSQEEQSQNEVPQTEVSPNRLIEKLNKIKLPIKIPYKNKLLIDEHFELKDNPEKYKYYLSFYIIDAINNIADSSSGE